MVKIWLRLVKILKTMEKQFTSKKGNNILIFYGEKIAGEWKFQIKVNGKMIKDKYFSYKQILELKI